MAASASSAPAKPRRRSVASTKATKGDLPETDMRRYDWSRATRERYAKHAAAVAAHIRWLDADLVKLFPTNADVNAALRAVADAAKRLRKAG